MRVFLLVIITALFAFPACSKSLSYTDKLKLIQNKVPIIRYSVPLKKKNSVIRKGLNSSKVRNPKDSQQTFRASKAIKTTG